MGKFGILPTTDASSKYEMSTHHWVSIKYLLLERYSSNPDGHMDGLVYPLVTLELDSLARY